MKKKDFITFTWVTFLPKLYLFISEIIFGYTLYYYLENQTMFYRKIHMKS